MESYFDAFRNGVIGLETEILTPHNGWRRIVYADWTASGRNYEPIERRIQQDVMPYVANTHSEMSTTGSAMTYIYHHAQQVIRRHVNANSDDVLITAGSGMTRVINKFQRLLGIRHKDHGRISTKDRPVVFISHMEHHSNHISWLETTAILEIIRPTPGGQVDLEHLRELLTKYEDHKVKFASVTACSNVTGIVTPYHEIAALMHEHDAYCFVDFACSAPYVLIDMHPAREDERLDAVFFSPHKFLGGPGSSAVLVFNRCLYKQNVPDHPGGGCVDWTNPWGKVLYMQDIESREDGGTPAFLQTVKSALCIRLKDEMGVNNILARERQLFKIVWNRLRRIPGIRLLQPDQTERLGIISFCVDGLHHNLATRMLNDQFGIQCRGGCSCAGTYGHHLLGINQEESESIANAIERRDASRKPGWIRISLHPVMTDAEAIFIGDSVAELAQSHSQWTKHYIFDPSRNYITTVDSKLDYHIKSKMDEVLSTRFTGRVLRNPLVEMSG